jgi:hypothetical protein
LVIEPILKIVDSETGRFDSISVHPLTAVNSCPSIITPMTIPALSCDSFRRQWFL